jgi:hypothetical protein
VFLLSCFKPTIHTKPLKQKTHWRAVLGLTVESVAFYFLTGVQMIHYDTLLEQSLVNHKKQARRDEM